MPDIEQTTANKLRGLKFGDPKLLPAGDMMNKAGDELLFYRHVCPSTLLLLSVHPVSSD